MIRRNASLLSLMSILFLVSCQHLGGTTGIECVAGFVKVQNGCRSANSLSSAELNMAEAQLEASPHRSEEEFLVRAETKKMISKMKEVRAVTERSQRSSEERFQAPASSLRPLSFGPLSRRSVEAPTSHLRSENAASFRNEFRGTSFSGSY